jgi:hypothetical protein
MLYYHMRKPEQLPQIPNKPRDYLVPRPITGGEFLSTPDDDIRWWVIAKDSHPPDQPLPVNFFELLAVRVSETDDMDQFCRKLRFPVVCRRYFADNPDRVGPYISAVIDAFPGIINRAGWLSDEKGLEEDFRVDIDKDDLKALLTSRLATAPTKDIPVIAEQIAKISGWNAPEQIQIAQYTEVKQLLATVRPKIDDNGYRPLPSADKEFLEQ